MITQPIAVACPRCTGDIMCTVQARIVPGPHGGSGVADLRITDLADRFAEHYVQAGHSAQFGVIDVSEPLSRDGGPIARLAAGLAGARPELP